MKMQKIICISLAAISMSSVTLLAQAELTAHNLTLDNRTSQDSTAIINDGKCSSESLPGGVGVTKAHTKNTIDAGIVFLACAAAPTNCKAYVFMNNTCSGNK